MADFPEQYAPLRSGSGNSPMGDMLDAFKMFSTSVNQLALTRSLQKANNDVQQIKNSELSDQEKESQMRSVAQGLTASMIGLGSPAAAVKQAYDTYAPAEKPLLQSFDQAMIYGDPKQQAAAQAAEKFKTDEKIRFDKATAGQGGVDPFKQMVFDMGVDKFVQNKLMEVGKRVDPMATSSRALGGRLANMRSKLQEVQGGILSQDWNKINNLGLEELPKVIDTVLSGGVGTISGVEHLRLPSLKADAAKLIGRIRSKPTAADVPEIVGAYNDIVDRLEKTAYLQQSEGMRNTLRSEGTFAKKFPGALEGLNNRAQAFIQNPDGTPDSLGLDPSSGKLKFASDVRTDAIKNDIGALSQGMDDPRWQEAMDAIKSDPFMELALTRNPGLQQKMKVLEKKRADFLKAQAQKVK